MKYCIPYSKKSKYKDKVDELIFPYDREKNIAIGKTLLDSGDLFSNQRVIIEILDYNFFTQWKTLEIFKELKIKKQEIFVSLPKIGGDYETFGLDMGRRVDGRM